MAGWLQTSGRQSLQQFTCVDFDRVSGTEARDRFPVEEHLDSSQTCLRVRLTELGLEVNSHDAITLRSGCPECRRYPKTRCNVLGCR